MTSKYTNLPWSLRVWDWMARPSRVGMALLALTVVEWLRVHDPSEQATLVVRFVAVVSLVFGLVFLVDTVRPSLRRLAELREGQLIRAWWFPFFREELVAEPSRSRVGWFASLAVWSLMVIVAPAVVLTNALQTHAVGELVLLPGQGAEAFLETAPEPGLRRAMGVKLELMRVAMDEVTPVATLRATDMRSNTSTEIALRSAEASRVRGIVVAMKELRPLGGLGAVTLRVGEGPDAREVRIERGMDVDLGDGRTLRWAEASANRLGVLGPAVQIAVREGDRIASRRWLYVESPELSSVRASDELSLTLVGVSQPSALVVAVREVPAPPWGLIGGVLLGVWLLALALVRWVPGGLVGRNGDWVVLASAAPQGRERALALLRPELREGADAQWVQPLREEDV